MDFKTVLSNLLAAFKEHNIRYALMGGLALSAWGVPRGTVDIDFLVHREDMTKVDVIMRGLGYEIRNSTGNVSQYLSPLKIFGEVDFIHAFRSYSLSMLDRAEELLIFDTTLPVRVLKIEDLIGFKLQAMKNNEKRAALDLSDIENLMAAKAGEIDWLFVKEYFSLFGCEELYNELKGKYGKNQQR